MVQHFLNLLYMLLGPVSHPVKNQTHVPRRLWSQTKKTLICDWS